MVLFPNVCNLWNLRRTSHHYICICDTSFKRRVAKCMLMFTSYIEQNIPSLHVFVNRVHILRDFDKSLCIEPYFELGRSLTFVCYVYCKKCQYPRYA
jgi:hypothetical protein